MGAVRMRVQTADKNITIIHTTPVHQLMSSEDETNLSLRRFFTLNSGFNGWRHPFTAEHPLVSKWCNATFLQTWWRNKLILISDSLRVSGFSTNINFWVNCCFNSYLNKANFDVYATNYLRICWRASSSNYIFCQCVWTKIVYFRL